MNTRYSGYLRQWESARYSKSSTSRSCGVAVRAEAVGAVLSIVAKRSEREAKRSRAAKRYGDCVEGVWAREVVADEEKCIPRWERMKERGEPRHNHVLHAPCPKPLPDAVTRGTVSPILHFRTYKVLFYVGSSVPPGNSIFEFADWPRAWFPHLLPAPWILEATTRNVYPFISYLT